MKFLKTIVISLAFVLLESSWAVDTQFHIDFKNGNSVKSNQKVQDIVY